MVKNDLKTTGRRTALSLAAFAVAAIAGSWAYVGLTSAESASATDTIKTRQQGFKALGAASKLIRDELSDTSSADAGKIKTAALDIKKAADAMAGWFPAGTGPQVGVKTQAKPEIWSDTKGFANAREAFVREAGKFVELASAGNTVALNEATKALGQACKGCHDSYRAKKE